MASTSSTITAPPQVDQGKHDVFLCFRGADTRDNFVSFLHRELVDRNGIETYIDYRLDGGEEIEPGLLKKITESLISVVIFSKNFAGSTFCLREVSQIQKTKGQIVIPVFYQVDPTDIKELRNSFADGLAKHEGECDAKEVESWRHDLKVIANLKGWDSNIIKPDTILVDKIVEDIQKKLNQMPSWVSPSTDLKRLVGIDSRVNEVESKISIGTLGMIVVGLWGMPGVGKTTITEVVYRRIAHQFEGSCFLRNVRDELSKSGLLHVLQEIIGEVLEKKDFKLHSFEEIDSNVKRMLQRKKILIVLDDVSSFKQIEEALVEDDLLGQGSRIVLTSRDKQVVENQFCDHDTYEVRELGNKEALQLFKLHAFKGNDECREWFKLLSERAVSYTKGNPLALKVLGSNLCNKGLKEWESTLVNLKGSSLDPEIRKILMVSYDGLDWKQKRIFLDIACFFGRCNRDLVQYTLDQCGFDAERGIDRLIDKCLLNISDNEIWMHDLLQQLGQDIVHHEDFDDPRKRSRLWIPGDIDHLLTHYQGTEKIQSISLDISKIQEMNLKPSVFEGMCNLRFLEFYLPGSINDVLFAGGGSKLFFPEGLEFLPKKLRILRWDRYPLECMPPKFCPTNLVQLIMRACKLLDLWTEVSPLVHLKHLEVTWSGKLTTINSVLSKAPNLEVLNLTGCEQLRILDLSKVPNLEVLNVTSCQSLDEVPSTIESCTKLTRLHLTSCRCLRTLCSAVEHLSQLVELDISGCFHLDSLPSSIGKLKYLKKFNLGGCLSLEELPNSIRSLVSLQVLNLGSTGIKNVPVSIKQLSNLTTLILSYCIRLQCIPELPSRLYCLDASECRYLESVAGIFTQAVQISNDQYYEAAFENFDFTDCIRLSENSRLNIIDDAKLRIRRMATFLSKQGYSGEAPIGFRLYPRLQCPRMVHLSR